MNELYESAIAAEENGSVNRWFIEYLNGSGRNKVLAQGLDRDGKYHTGFLEYPLKNLKLLLGPDKSFRYYEQPEIFNRKVGEMIDTIKKGWKPVPLIATNLWNEGIELNDGAHRVAALVACGYRLCVGGPVTARLKQTKVSPRVDLYGH